ncbi:unnamed protein product [Adineta ricciae]|uniref:Uncharacterized protein n=1 Tax=Adineta ricciae TaxID=249248 RepID=A0A813YWV3_ADIRI|nr:unnamed protein product [Adineta ricciae]
MLGRIRPPIRPIENEPSEPPQFCFALGDTNEMDDQITTGADESPLVDDSQSQQQQNLTQEQLQQLFSRASSQLVAQSHDRQDFFKRDASIKAPKTGQIIQAPFPPPAEDRREDADIDPEKLKQLAQQEAGPLIIERYSPTETKINHPMTTVTITFNQPMIAVSTLDENTNVDSLGISLTPHIEGRWRWTGTKTVQFEAKHRLPFATKYTLQVKKDKCVSAIGGKLADELAFEFVTKPPSVVHFSPSGTVSTLKPKCCLLFDQKIDQNQILQHLCIVSNDRRRITINDLELLDEAVVKKEFEGFFRANEGIGGRCVAFTFKTDLSKATQYSVKVPAGCPSAEGPLKSATEWSADFKTYEPLKITHWQPNKNGRHQLSINPGESWSVTFNNSLNHSTINKSIFKIEPEVSGLGIEHVEHNDQHIIIHNNSKPNTVYTLTIQSEMLKDIHGQTLEHDFAAQPIEFHVHHSPPPRGHLSGVTGMIIMDPGVLDDPFYPFMVYNYSEVTLRVNLVQPEDYRRDLPCFQPYLHQRRERVANTHLPGKELINQTIQTDCERDVPKEMKFPLKSYLAQETGVGQLMISIEPTEKAWKQCQHHEWEEKPVISAWLQCTRLAIDVFHSSVRDGANIRFTTWITDLMTGVPVPHTTVSISDQKGETNQQGLCTIVQNIAKEKRREKMLIVRKGKDSCLLPDIYCYASNVNTYVWHVFNDRGLYKPKEEVHIKGYVRYLAMKGDAKLPTYAQGIVDYAVHDPRGQQLHASKIELNNYGAFDIKFTLPDNVNLGEGWVTFNLPSSHTQTTHSFKIQEFRRPEYQVSSTTRPTTVHYSHPTNDQYVIASCQGKLFAGGFLSDANVQWNVSAETTTFTPPNRSEYTFGRARPFFCWFGNNDDKKITYPSQHFQGKTDSRGAHEVKITYHGIETEPRPTMVRALAAITDLNNQTQETQTQFLIHPSTYYVGFQMTTNYGKKDQPIQSKVIVTDIDGNLIDNVSVECKIVGTGKERKEDTSGLTIYEEIKDEQQITNVSSNKDAITIEFTPKLGGQYNITFTVKDEQGRLAMSFYENLYVTGGAGKEIQQQKVEYIPTDTLTIIPNATNYQAGDKCELLVLAPFSPAAGLVLFDCEGEVSQPVQFQVESGRDSATVEFQISQDWIPGFTANVELTGSLPRDTEESEGPNRPAIAVGSVALEVSRDVYKLNVSVNTKDEQKTFTPSSTIHIDVDITQFGGKTPTNTVEVCLVVVDEAILSLTDYKLSSPLDVFYPNRSTAISQQHGRDRCLLFNMQDIQQFKKQMQQSMSRGMVAESCMMKHCCYAAPMACCCMDRCSSRGGGGGGVADQSIAVRSNFNPLACWVPSASTDSSGHVSFDFKLPDNLTRYRVWAIATNEQQYGLGEMAFTVQLPVMIRPSPPRFLNYGDTAKFSVVLQNQTDQLLSLHAGLKAANAKLITSETNQQFAGYAVQLKPNKRAAVVFPLSTVDAGTARFQFIVSTIPSENQAPFGDAIELSVPVFTPATSEAFATYGDVSEENVVFQPIKTPENVIPQFGELSVSTSSTALASLTDAIISLYTYPYECTEQLSSRLLGVHALWDVLQAFQCKDLPQTTEIATKLQSDINALKGRQYPNGGFSYWTNRSDRSADPFVSIHATHCLVVVTKKQLCDVKINTLRDALRYASHIESEIDALSYAKYWSKTTKFSLMSYALYVRAKDGQNVANEAVKLFERSGLKQLSLEALGWLLVALSTEQNKQATALIDSIYKYLKGKVSETAETANFITSYGDDGQSVMLHSNQRTDAILLEALLYIDPQSTLCTKICKGLQAHKVKGAWKSTQENCFVLIALEKYFHIKEKDTPDFVAKIWLDNDYCGQHQYKGRTTNTTTVDIPMKVVLSQSNDKNLIMQKDGRGRLYYRIALNYAPTSLQLNAANYGFKIERTYVGVDDPSHVQKQEDGTWKFKLGEKVKVVLTMTTTQRRYHIALVDYLPAGCEALNTQLKGTITGDTESSVTRSDPSRYYLNYITGWTEHENLRDERAEAFRSLLWPGVYQWSYTMRATCAGTFIMPPAKAEEMYSPENFGRSATEKAIIN